MFGIVASTGWEELRLRGTDAGLNCAAAPIDKGHILPKNWYLCLRGKRRREKAPADAAMRYLRAVCSFMFAESSIEKYSRGDCISGRTTTMDSPLNSGNNTLSMNSGSTLMQP